MLLSTQVLQEFYVAVTRKLAPALAPETAYHAVRDLATLPLVLVDAGMVLAAIQGGQEHQLSFWDSLIVRAAVEGGAGVLYSEDFQHGRDFGGLRVENPFL
jgi:predicted nucleic acid-binding protein